MTFTRDRQDAGRCRERHVGRLRMGLKVMLSEVTESNYGSDKTGLVWGYVFTPEQAANPINCDAAAEFLATETAEVESFLWLHFNLANAASERWLRENFALPDPFFESLHDSTSTRVEHMDAVLVAVLNDVAYPDVSNRSCVSVCANRHMLVSARTTALRSLDRLRASVRAGAMFRSPSELLAHLLRDQADVLVQIVREVTQEVDDIEDTLMTSVAASNRAKLGSWRRLLVRLRRLIAPEPAALFRLLNRPPSWLSTRDLEDLRQSAEELSVAVSDAAALVERIRVIQEEMLALVNEHTNRTLFVLTVVTVLSLPLTIVPGLFGMNVGGIPFAQHAVGFWIVVGLLAIWVGVGGFLVFRTHTKS